ncbi:MAG: arginyltransferase [Methylotenera sp.]|nr:arginyltransferase [Methylotenera sp.]
MSLPNEKPLHKLQFYVTTPYKCGYLPKKMAQSLIASPQHLIDANIYNGLITQGFRRSGKFAYRPHCENCRACIAVRLVLSEFAQTRSQKRAYKQHSSLSAQILPLHFNQQHYELYESYQSLRHQDETVSESSAKTKDDAEQFRQFLCQSNVESLMIEFKDANNQVKIVSVVDILKDGVSAVYTFYDATEPKASYGTYSIMWLAEWTKNLNLSYLYLGYWIKDSQKMAYKEQFKPQQKLIDGEWL